jgi:hypothetical protein
VHSEICAVPGQRLEAALSGRWPSLAGDECADACCLQPP